MSRLRPAGPARQRRDADLTPLREIRPGPPDSGLSRWWVARAAWEDVVGAELARRLVFLRAEGKTWIIAVPSASWAAELGRLEGRLLDDLGRRPELGTVRHLQALVGGAPVAEAPADTRREAPRLAPGGDARTRLEDLARRLMAARSGESS
jgi:hypothetical protein